MLGEHDIGLFWNLNKTKSTQIEIKITDTGEEKMKFLVELRKIICRGAARMAFA